MPSRSFFARAVACLFSLLIGVSSGLRSGSEAREAGNGPQVRKCVSGVHTYLNLGDGGCFQHLEKDGTFASRPGADIAYKEKFCPFAGPRDAWRRKALYRWYLMAIVSGAPPFSVSDLARSCIFGDTETVGASFKKSSYFNSRDVTGWQFCETMLSLPLMFEAIGFDGPGLMLEDSRTKRKVTFKGANHQLSSQSQARPGPWNGCTSWLSSPLGSARHARLALRAVLPTYFRHVYTEGKSGMFSKGVDHVFDSHSKDPSSWEEQVREVCEAAGGVAEKLEDLMSLESLRAGRLLSQKVLSRDRSTCQRLAACNYDPDASTHIGACELCREEKYPFFNNENGLCYNMHGGDGFEACTNPSAKTRRCDCHKAICWYFTSDFAAALDVAQSACSHVTQLALFGHGWL